MSIQIDKKKRLKEVFCKAGVLLCIGILYAFIYISFGVHIPCLFNKITGFLCPGCGISAMCISLLYLDVDTAYFYNPGIMIALPFILILLGSLVWRYVVFGSWKTLKWQNMLACGLAASILIYGVIRNINF